MLGDEDAAAEITENLFAYMGNVFETIFCQYLIRLAKQRKLPFIPHNIDRWWGQVQKRKSRMTLIYFFKSK